MEIKDNELINIIKSTIDMNNELRNEEFDLELEIMEILAGIKNQLLEIKYALKDDDNTCDDKQEYDKLPLF